MRKIEEQMVSAIKAKRNMNSANTIVVYRPSEDDSMVYLHYNLIAIIGHQSECNNSTLYIHKPHHDPHYNSRTTLSRWNALLDAFAPEYTIRKRQGVVYVIADVKDEYFGRCEQEAVLDGMYITIKSVSK